MVDRRNKRKESIVMLKYAETKVTFSEVPDEISLCINISNCPCKCQGCHSSYLAEDIGTVLDTQVIDLLIKGNKGISCISFMGGDSNPEEINNLAEYIKKFYNLKIAWYSGRQELSTKINLENFDFIKLGPYKENKGPLNKKTTNQKFYEVIKNDTNEISLLKRKWYLKDITYKFWKNND